MLLRISVLLSAHQNAGHLRRIKGTPERRIVDRFVEESTRQILYQREHDWVIWTNAVSARR